MTAERHAAMNGPGPTLKKTVTRADLQEAVYQKAGLSRKESVELVELVLKEVADCLERGQGDADPGSPGDGVQTIGVSQTAHPTPKRTY